jgi:hypothetical protein
MLTWTNKVLAGLIVYPENMTRNLDALHGLLLSENVMLKLGEKIGRQASHEVVYELCMEAFEKRIPLKSLLLKDKRVNKYLTEKQIDELLDPTKYTGLAAQFVDQGAGEVTPAKKGRPRGVSGPILLPAHCSSRPATTWARLAMTFTPILGSLWMR